VAISHLQLHFSSNFTPGNSLPLSDSCSFFCIACTISQQPEVVP
jgi:hypothetical protein